MSDIVEKTFAQPVIIEEGPVNGIPIDIYSRLLMDRIIFIGTTIDNLVANTVCSQLIYLNSINNDPIQIFINSPGGSVTDGLQIIDCINLIKSPVYTIGMGLCASMAAIILSNGKKGYRTALPNARIMIHQPSGGCIGKTTDMEIALKEFGILRKNLYEVLANNTGKTIEEIEELSKDDNWMSSKDAQEFGIIDKVINKKGIL